MFSGPNGFDHKAQKPSKLTIGHSDIHGVGVCSVDDARPGAVVPVEVGLLDEDIAVLLIIIAHESNFVIQRAITLIVLAGVFLLCIWDLKLRQNLR